jgi:hypothetical protein
MGRSCKLLENVAMAIQLLVVGSVVVFVAVLARVAWSVRGRTAAPGSVSEAQARENAAPLTMAILESVRRNRERRR